MEEEEEEEEEEAALKGLSLLNIRYVRKKTAARSKMD